MKGGPDEDRRRFLAGAGGAVLGLAASPLLVSLSGCGPSDALAAALAGFYADRESARTVGVAFLERFPDEDDLANLVRQLARSAVEEERWAALAGSDPAALPELLRARHRADFGAGRVVLLNGWVLSQTEVRLCALAAKRG